MRVDVFQENIFICSGRILIRSIVLFISCSKAIFLIFRCKFNPLLVWRSSSSYTVVSSCVIRTSSRTTFFVISAPFTKICKLLTLQLSFIPNALTDLSLSEAENNSSSTVLVHLVFSIIPKGEVGKRQFPQLVSWLLLHKRLRQSPKRHRRGFRLGGQSLLYRLCDIDIFRH